jgi:hypothetical protein
MFCEFLNTGRQICCTESFFNLFCFVVKNSFRWSNFVELIVSVLLTVMKNSDADR